MRLHRGMPPNVGAPEVRDSAGRLTSSVMPHTMNSGAMNSALPTRRTSATKEDPNMRSSSSRLIKK